MEYNRYNTTIPNWIEITPFAFINELNKAANTYDNGAGELLREAACVISNLLLTDANWRCLAESGVHNDAVGYAPNGHWCGECCRDTCALCPTWIKIQHTKPKQQTEAVEFDAGEWMWRRFALLVDGKPKEAFINLLIRKGITREDLIQILNSVKLNTEASETTAE